MLSPIPPPQTLRLCPFIPLLFFVCLCARPFFCQTQPNFAVVKQRNDERNYSSITSASGNPYNFLGAKVSLPRQVELIMLIKIEIRMYTYFNP